MSDTGDQSAAEDYGFVSMTSWSLVLACWCPAGLMLQQISALQRNLQEPHSHRHTSNSAAAAGGAEGGGAGGAIPRRRHDTLTSRGVGGAAEGSSQVLSYNIKREGSSGVKGKRSTP